jgi:hypothetical protein
MFMKKTTALFLALFFLLESFAWAGLDSDKAMYVGGTVTSLKDGTEGTASTKNESLFVFNHSGGKLEVPYERINDLEYGQKAGRRLGVAIAVTWMALFSKKRRHFLTIGYKDDNDKQQAAVFELGKNTVRVTLASLEARTGKKIDYEDDEARKGGRGN